MRKNILISPYIIIFFLTISCAAKAQVNQEWAARYSTSGNNYDRANKIVSDASGNIYVAGSVAVSSTNWDYITIKYNSAGVQQWFRTYNGPGNFHDQAYDIAADNSGNIYVTGGSFGSGTERDFCTIKYNPNGDSLWVRRYNGPGNNIDEAVSIYVDAANVYVSGYSDRGMDLDYYTIKYNLAGAEQWAARYNFPTGLGNEDRPHDMTVDAAGNTYVTGESNTGFGFLDMYATVKYNSSGQQQWAARYKGSADSGLSQAYALAVDPSGSVYVTGRSDPSNPFGLNFDIVTIKYNSSGDSVWVRRHNGTSNSSDAGNDIALDGSGNVVVTGLSVTNTGSDYFTVKYSQAGDIQWTAGYNGPQNSVDAASSLVIDALGNIYVTGLSTGSGSLRDYATVKYNPSGLQQWVQRYNGPGNNDDESRSIAIHNNNVYITGMSSGSGSGMDLATIKYSQSVGIIQISNEIPSYYALFQNYPNPFNPSTKIRFDISIFSQEADPLIKIILYDALGREVEVLLNEQLRPGSYEVTWDASGYPSGVYFYKLETGTFQNIKKMILLK